MALEVQRCMAHLMEIKEEHVLEIPPLKPLYDKTTVSPTPLEEATLLEELQVAGGSGEQAPELEDVTGLEEITTGSQALQMCPLLLLGFEMILSTSEPPLLEGIALLIRLPNLEGAQPVLTPIRALQMVKFKNELTGNMEYQYQAQIVGSLCLDSPVDEPKITEL